MWITSEKAIKEAFGKHPKAEMSLKRWVSTTKAAQWLNIADVRKSYPDAGPVEVKSGKIATVFNICRNDYRLVTTIHYNVGRVFVLRFMTHAEYSKDTWKETL